MATDTDVLIIGAGMSGVGLAIQIVRKFGIRSFELVEKTEAIGGTWHVNSYPGCGCDVPSHFYSYSFAPKSDWSQKFAMQPEIQKYFDDVAEQYGIPSHVRFHTELKTADWNAETASWVVQLKNTKSGTTYTRRTKILVSAVGSLSVPRALEIPGAEKFKGRLFHSARWDHCFDHKDKEVICIGNGCSATQFVPVMSTGPGKVKKITQFTRQPHWLMERVNPKYSDLFKWTMKYIPGAMRIYRSYLFLMQEKDFAALGVDSGIKYRKEWTDMATAYIQKNAPAKYRDALIPKITIACKRLVMDTDYLASLHRNNVELVHDDPIAEITKTGILTQSGRSVPADALVLATGFETQTPLFPMTIRGADGETIQDHWKEFGQGSAEAYFGTCLSNFPNFFIMMGPNTLSGHLSVIFTSECQINFTLKAIAPILKSLHPPLWASLLNCTYPDSVVVRRDAEEKDVQWADKKAAKLVWATGCTSWFIDEKTGRNTAMYPDWQSKFWLRSVFLPWRDFVYAKSRSLKAKENDAGGPSLVPMFAGGIVLAAALVAGGSLVGGRNDGFERLRGGVNEVLGRSSLLKRL